MRELEFLPDDYLRARFQRRIGFIRSWLLLAIGLAMVLYSFQMGTWVRDARAELRALRGTGSAVKADVNKVRMLRAEARAYNRRIEHAERLEHAVGVTAVVADVADAMADGVVLERMEVILPTEPGRRPATVRLEGLAANEEGVTQTVAGLDASERFAQTLLAESTLVKGPAEGCRAFAIEAEVRPDAGRPRE